MASSDELATWGLEAMNANDYETAAKYFHQLRMQDSNHWAPTFMIRYCTAELNTDMESMLGNLEQLNAALPETAAKIAPELTDNQTAYAGIISTFMRGIVVLNTRNGLELLKAGKDVRKVCRNVHDKGLEGLFLWLDLLDRQLHNANAIKGFLKELFELVHDGAFVLDGPVVAHVKYEYAKNESMLRQNAKLAKELGGEFETIRIRPKNNTLINALPEKYINQIEDVVTRYNCCVEEWAEQKRLHAQRQKKLEEWEAKEERRKKTEGYAEGKAATVAGLIAFVVFIIGKLILFKGTFGTVFLVLIAAAVYSFAHSMLKKDYEKARQKYIGTGEGNL